MMVAAQAVTNAALAIAAAAVAGDDVRSAVDMLARALGVQEDLGAMARGYDVGEAVIEAACDRAVAEDRAYFRRPRRGLRAVP